MIIVGLTLLPLGCCFMKCMSYGISISDIYLPNSLYIIWNDEVSYFKQIEGAVRYGLPQGYFGYNESRALSLSFGPWSPVLMIFYYVWGKIFGWTVMSPVLCNLCLMSVAMFLFAVLVKPKKMQAFAIGGLFAVFYIGTRY